MRYVIIALGAALFLGLVDYYVFRNWRLFARYRKLPLRVATRVYHVLVYVMPLSLPAYLYFFRWWEVEPKVVRAAVLGIWAVYYVPKIPIALVLLLKDGTRFVSWQFRWFQRYNRRAEGSPPESAKPPELSDMKRISRSEFIRQMGWGASSIPFVVVGYGVFRSLYDYQVVRQSISLANLPPALDGITIAHISDLHAGSFFSRKPIDEAIDVVNSLRPDLLVFTGDFVNNDAAELDVALPAFEQLRAELGAYACLGNHDHYARVGEVINRVAATNLRLLVNENDRLIVGGATLHIIGTDNTGFNQRYADLPAAMAGIALEREENDLRLLLTHDPSYWDEVRSERPDVDITLCGHTHGGQLGFEFGPVRWSLARIVYARWAGLYREAPRGGGSAQYLYVNRGLGTVGPPMRVGIRPEVTLLTLRRA